MKQKKIETHKIGLIGQGPSRRGDPRKPLAGPNGKKIARLGGMSYDELISCRRKHLNSNYSGKGGRGDGFDHAKGNVNAADVLLDWRVERIVLVSIAGGTNDETNNALDNFCSGFYAARRPWLDSE